MAFTYKHGDRPLDGYEIQRGVGRGGFGEVYYAISDGGREVALKYLRENPEVELRGIASCINLKSPHLVSIFDVKQNQDGDYFVIMEYISGPSLRDLLIAEPNGLGAQKAAFFCREIGKGLGYLHDQGIVHRDLKPGNIFYEDGYVKICDYGLSKYISVSRHSAQTASVGTVHYMAPEVGSGNYSRTIDIYALGVILYEMLLGRVPYEGASMGEVLMKHLTSQPEVDELPKPFGRVIRQALAKDPAERYQDVNAMVAAVFGEEDIRRSVHGFEPSSLTTVAARALHAGHPSPTPSDNPLLPRSPADLRQSGMDFSRRFVERTRGLDVHMSRKERRKRKKREKKAEARLLGVDHPAGGTAEDRLTFGQKVARLFTAMVVAGGAAVALGVIWNNEEVGAVSFGLILLSVIGIGVGHRVARYLGPDHPDFIGRLLIMAGGAPALIALWAAADDGPFHHICRNSERAFVPLLVVFALVDWSERIRLGRRGEFGWWEAFCAGLVAFVAAAITSNGNSEWLTYLAGLAASISLSVQIFSWALSRRPAGIASGDPPHQPGQSRDNLDDTRYSEPPRAYVAAAMIGTGVGRSPASAVVGRRAVRHERPVWKRWAAWVLCLASCAGVLIVAILMGVGEIRSDDDIAFGTVALTALAMGGWGWLMKVGRFSRPSPWREWGSPFATLLAGIGISASISAMALLRMSNDEFAFSIVILVISSIVLLALLFDRVRWSWAALPESAETAAVPFDPFDRPATDETIAAPPPPGSGGGRMEEFVVPRSSPPD